MAKQHATQAIPSGTILVANRGEIAARILKAIRDAGERSALIYHPSEALSPITGMADEAFPIQGETPTAAFLDIDQIVQLCVRKKISAVHPGYGFLAENAEFAERLTAEGIRFIGPRPNVIRLMGDKIISRNFVRDHGFPVAPSSVLDDDRQRFLDEASTIPLPLVIKASAGGGGKGMHIVRSLEDLPKAMELAASEAQRYFGDDRIYAERYIENPRHIEVQILADEHGHCIHLWERECSVQRRFQKIIEESPSPALNASQREEICNAAVGIARAANYSGAGTVEFIFANNGDFYFLEMNTRIQVEHPVTEMVTGVDLVGWQIRIANGEALSLSQENVPQNGHAIECRICAEQPEENFIPGTGTVLALSEPEGDSVRFDSGLYRGQIIDSNFDPMLAKLIVHADNREQAINKTLAALADTVILGLPTNTNFLQRLVDHSEFRSGETFTSFVKTHENSLQAPQADDTTQALLAAAACMSDPQFRQFVSDIPELHRSLGHWRN